MIHDIQPEQFASALGEVMEKIHKLTEDFRPISTAAECYHMRRVKQNKLGEALLENVPMGMEVAAFRRFELDVARTRARLEIVALDDLELEPSSLRLVSGPSTNKSGE